MWEDIMEVFAFIVKGNALKKASKFYGILSPQNKKQRRQRL